MKKLYAFTIILVAFISLQSYKYIEETTNPGKKIGTIKNGQYIITVDTLALKKHWEATIDQPDIKLDKVEIKKGTVLSKKKEDYYMLLGHVKGKNAKAAHWLVKDGNDFYFHKISEEMRDDEIFYCTYYFINCTDNSSTTPMVLDFGDGYGWSTSEKPVCSPNSPCKTTSSLNLEEEYNF